METDKCKRPELSPDAKNKLLMIAFFYAVFIGSIMIFCFFPVMRSGETVPLILAVTLPFAILLGRAYHAYVLSNTAHGAEAGAAPGIFQESNPAWMSWLLPKRVERLQKNTKAMIIFGYLVIWAACASGVLFANRYLDQSQAQRYVVPITHKYTERGKNSTSYRVVVPSPATPLLPYAYDNDETITVNDVDYQRVIPGQSKIALDVHKGFLGLPWCEVPSQALTHLDYAPAGSR